MRPIVPEPWKVHCPDEVTSNALVPQTVRRHKLQSKDNYKIDEKVPTIQKPFKNARIARDATKTGTRAAIIAASEIRLIINSISLIYLGLR